MQLSRIASTLDKQLIYGSSGNDAISGSKGADLIWGGDGNDTISGLSGNDFLYCGNGDDTASGENGSDRLSGNAGNDFLSGNAGNDFLYGDAGNDTLNGGIGIDLLDGGMGKDILTGGAGIDYFHYWYANESGKDADMDIITDFTHGVDKIDLHNIDAKDLTPLFNDTFKFIGEQNFNRAGQVRFANGILYININSDLGYDSAIQLNGVTVLQSSDFFL